MSFEIDVKKLFSYKVVKVESAKSAIEKVECDARPTFSKVLTELGLTFSDYEQLKVSESSINRKTAHLLELYKQHLEGLMEERLIYQENLPKFYNHNSLMFAMKKSNPIRYGDKVVEIVKTEKSGNVSLDDLENKSGFSINEKVVS